MNCVNDIRLEQFLQLKKGIRGSEKHLIVGIDAAKEKHNAFFGTARGKTLVKNLVFDNTLEGFQKLLAYVERIKVQYSLTTVVFGIEPTANYHKPLAEHLIKCGHLVVLVGGVAVKNNRQLLDGRWDKHDVKDAANVADLIAQGKCLFYEYPLMTLRNVRILIALKVRSLTIKDRVEDVRTTGITTESSLTRNGLTYLHSHISNNEEGIIILYYIAVFICYNSHFIIVYPEVFNCICLKPIRTIMPCKE